MNGDFSLTRLSLFTENYSIGLGSWTRNQNRQEEDFSYSDLYSWWIRSPKHAETHSYMSLRGAISIWKTENIPTFYFNIEKDLSDRIDVARDLAHPGRETIKMWAKTIASKILTHNSL